MKKMDQSCALHDAYSPTKSHPQMDPEREVVGRNMEDDGGKRDEGQRLDMGPPGMTSHRQKPVVISGGGLMFTCHA